MGISKGCLAWVGVVALIGPLQALPPTRRPRTGAGRNHGHGAEALGEPTDRAVVDNHLRRRGAARKGRGGFFRLWNKGTELRIRLHGRRHEHGAHDLDSRRVRRQCHGILCGRNAAPRFARSANSRHRPHRGVARAAGALSTERARWAAQCASSPRRPISTDPRSPLHAGTSTPLAPTSQLDGRHRRELPYRGDRVALRPRLSWTIRGGLFQAALLYRSRHRGSDLLSPTPSGASTTTVDNVGETETYGGRSGSASNQR